MSDKAADRGIEPIRASMSVDAAPADAFAGFTEGMAIWWPREYSWSGALLERIGMEAGPGGLLYEIGGNGMRYDWGRISAWEPPRRLGFTWHIGPGRVPDPNPAHASEVRVAFEPAQGDGTTVSVVHGGWERHGEPGRAYRQQMADADAWETILGAYAAAVRRRSDAPWTGLTT
jgi:uncharacterized protein YndB with AHSA1/START domain